MNNQRWEEIFWLIALLPAVGIAVWLVLSRESDDRVAQGLSQVKGQRGKGQRSGR